MLVLDKMKQIRSRISWRGWVAIFILFALIVIIPSLWLKLRVPPELVKLKPVKIMSVTAQTGTLALEYLGTVNAVDVTKYSFKAAGRVGEIMVTKGQPVTKGQGLVKMDTKDLSLAVEAARNTREQAKSAYDFAQDNYNKVTTLLEAGAVSRQDAERAKVELDSMRTAYNNAQIDYQNKLNILEDSYLKANLAGYVADVLYQEGEIVPAGYPVVVTRGEKLEVTVGLTQNDWGKVSPGMGARVAVLDKELTGKVTSVGQLPDQHTRTYPVTVGLEDISLPVGITAKVYLEIGDEQGMFVPITAISNDNRDFVFALDSELTVHKRPVQLGRIKGTEVMVKGLAEGEKIVLEGLKRLRDGDKVAVQE